MITQNRMISPSGNTILFDDRSLLEAAFGKDVLSVSSANANCDCISHSDPIDDEDSRAYQVALSAGQAY